jgi:hypothetical protein
MRKIKRIQTKFKPGNKLVNINDSNERKYVTKVDIRKEVYVFDDGTSMDLEKAHELYRIYKLEDMWKNI